MKEKKNKDKKRDLKNILVKTDGITLVALIITIIVLIILATVSINMVLGDEGIIVQARLTAQKQENSTIAEEKSVNELLVIYENAYENVKEGIGKETIENTVSYCSTSTVSYYADVDGDGTVDGIIFADLAIGDSGTWVPSSGYSFEYEYDAIESSSLKEYTISEDTYTDAYFGEGYVITPLSGTTGEDRFYVMALEDEIKNSDSEATSSYNYFYWWYSAYSTSYEGSTITDYSTLTSKDFGSGLANTVAVKEAWEAETYGTQNYKSTYDDMWSLDNIGANIGDSDSVWFVPSYKEIVAFGGVFEIDTDNYSEVYGLPTRLWTSSLYSATASYNTNYSSGGGMYNRSLYLSANVRLATTF